MPSQHKAGEKVVHIASGRKGHVVDSFDSDRGYRYIVRIGREYWSVPQRSLRALTPTQQLDLPRFGPNELYGPASTKDGGPNV